MINKAPFAYEGLNRIIHERARLAILTSLSAHQGAMSFNILKKSCGLTDGNLSRHLQILQEADFIKTDKYFEGNRPITSISITSTGQKRFLDYISILEKIVHDATEVQKQNVPSPKLNLT